MKCDICCLRKFHSWNLVCASQLDGDLSFSLYKENQGIKCIDLKIIFRSYNRIGKTINLFPYLTLRLQIRVKKKVISVVLSIV